MNTDRKVAGFDDEPGTFLSFIYGYRIFGISSLICTISEVLDMP